MDLITNGVSWLMPPQHERKSPSLHLVLSNVLPWFALYGLLSAFCRRPNTRLQRMLLGPILFFWGVRLSLGTKWCPPDDLGGNVVATMVFISLSFRALVFGLSPQSQKKVDEKIPGERHLHPPSIFHQFYWYIEDALDLSCTIRGVNYDFGSGSGLKLPVDKSIRQKYAKDGRKWAWLMHTFVYRVLPKFIMTDIINHLNLVISHFGGPDAFQKATLLQRLAIESWTFFLIVFNLGYLYDLVSILGVGIACNDISNWPPMFDQPWLSTSLHEFWAVRWHQFLRHVFLITCGYPLQLFAGRIGLIVGAFLSSGVLHSIMLNGVGKTGPSYYTILFFTVQSVGLFLETLFRKTTGRRVGGAWGRIWTIVFILSTGQGTALEWAEMGAMNLRSIPPSISPLQYLLPLIGFNI